jgi:hypothetical protein
MPAMDLMEHTAKVIQDVLNTHERRHPEIGAKAALGWLVARMTEAAAAAAWRNPGFTGRDRALFHGRAEALQAAVERLWKLLADHPDTHVRTNRFNDLHDALEAAAILAGLLEDSVFHRARTSARRGAAAMLVDQRRDIVREHALRIKQKYPSYTASRIAGRIYDAKVPGLEGLGRDAIFDHIKTLHIA